MLESGISAGKQFFFFPIHGSKFLLDRIFMEWLILLAFRYE